MSEKIGEIIDACTTAFTAQSYELYQLPPLGSLVKTQCGDLDLLGVVYYATTGSIDPGRKPIARGKDEPTEEAIYHSSPQLMKLLRSEFSVLVTGYKQHGIVYQFLPPVPARIHGFVYVCSREEALEFSRSLTFLDILINTRVEIPLSELVSACLRQLSLAHDDPRSFLVTAAKELVNLLGGQYQQIKAILERLQP